MFDEYDKVVKDWALPFIVIIVVFLIKFFLFGIRYSCNTLLRKFLVCLTVGLLANNYFIESDGFTESISLIFVAILTLLADGLVAGIIQLSRRMQDDPIKLAKEIRDIFRG